MTDKKKESPRKYAPTWEANPHQRAPDYGSWDDQTHKGKIWYQPIGKGKPPKGLINKIKSDLNTSGTRKNYPKE